MKKHFLLSLSVLFVLLISMFSCKENMDKFSTGDQIAVQWELIGNDLEGSGESTAKFTLTNNSDFAMNDSNWKLFFSQASILLLDPDPKQPATVEHINGDWYKMTPNKGFSLERGESVDVVYKGSSAMIKVTDSPLGSYFVFYNQDGSEASIAEVKDYTLVPFTRTEQINRGSTDQEPVPTPETTYMENASSKVVASKEMPLIIPSPTSVSYGSGSFKIDDQVSIVHAEELENEASYLAAKLKDVAGLQLNTSTEEGPSNSINLKLGSVKVNGIAGEAYSLDITGNGITITGNAAAGVFYGVQSLMALVPLEVYQQEAVSLELPALAIKDAPRLKFRGLHVDVSRNFQTKETILRILDMMSFYKLNRFLFYTTEDEGWRLEIEDLPELTSVGAQRHHTENMNDPVLHPSYGSGPEAYADGTYGSGYYTREDFIEILKYADARHITVIPELNFPGHARAAIKAMEARYERLMAEGDEEAANEYRLIDPEDNSKYYSAQNFKDNVVCVARESVYRFYEKVVDEIAEMYAEAGLEMNDFHAGGDEVAEGAWTGSPMALDLLKEHPEVGDPKNLQAYFFGELLKRLEKRNLRVHGWEEVALLKQDDGSYISNPAFAGRNVIPYIWNNLWDYDLGYRLANAGYEVVLCNVTNFYFDLAYNKDPLEPGLYWGGFVKTRDAWTFAPYDYYKTTLKSNNGRPFDIDKEFANVERLKPEARKNILGIEAQLWSETLKGQDMIEYYYLPKLMGFAESAWSKERKWETIENRKAREAIMDDDWNAFANALGQRELPRLNYINKGYNYRIPLPGAIIEGGMMKANVEFPGLDIRYTTDGSEPNSDSPIYSEPVKVDGEVRLKAFDASGRSSRTTVVSEDSIKEF